MKRISLLLIAIFFASFSFAQVKEALSPLEVNIDLFNNQQRAFPAIYIYEVDTLSLPFVDDFSTNKYRKYNAQPGDANVTSSVEYLLENAGVPYPAGTGFSSTQTYNITYDTLPGGGDTLILTPLPGTTITVNDLTQYPVLGVSQTVYPCYNILDTAFSVSPDTIPITCDLMQDSVMIYFVSAIDQNTAVWLDSYTYHNFHWPLNPPTIGVATFDGLDENGYPYEFTIPTIYDIGDYLTSKPIDLSSMVLGDSLYLSFYIESGGLGDVAEGSDSLVLEFYTPSTVTWNHIWSSPGLTTIDSFYQVMIPIKNTLYFDEAFQFRFKNYGTVTGSIDHWHLDYVFLDRFRTKNDTIRDDVAFRYQARTLLNNDYTSMPWWHYSASPATYMADTISVFQRNNNISGRLVGSNNVEVFYQGVSQFTWNNPVTPSIGGLSDFKTQFDINAAGYFYEDVLNDTCAVFDVMFTHQTTPDDLRSNDTMRFEQRFYNYYAYDDGTAEAAYGPIGEGAQLACGFTIVEPDTLMGIAIHFSPSVHNVDLKTFFLKVWDNTGTSGSPGNVLYQETSLMDVIYGNVQNKFHFYQFSTPLVVSGDIYVGWEQVDLEKLNIGFDRNFDNSSRIYYNIDGFTWNNTSFSGSLLMRPVFKWNRDYTIGVTEVESEVQAITLYPNPAQTSFSIASENEIEWINVLDVTGKALLQMNGAVHSINIEQLSNGIYFVQVKTPAGISSQKLVVKR